MRTSDQILLLVSKRKNSPFVAALVDWRLFENLFLDLNDIIVPVTQFTDRDELFKRLPALSEGLAENVTGSTDNGRSQRVLDAWKASDEMFDQASDGDVRPSASSGEILSSIRTVVYEARHLRQWPVWTGNCDHGTALLVSGSITTFAFKLLGAMIRPRGLLAAVFSKRFLASWTRLSILLIPPKSLRIRNSPTSCVSGKEVVLKRWSARKNSLI